MFEPVSYQGTQKDHFDMLRKQLLSLIEEETDRTANLANASALLHQFLENVNWTGIYLYHEEDEELVLGPFQGLPACIRIPFEKGVCGTSASEKRTVRVDDVNSFPGHIACDAASRSEIVVPLLKDGHLIGVLDIDSPVYNRFSEEDQQFLEQFAAALTTHL
ncbi:GAF domain-containing protein [Salibacterium halotolerans]|uniref:GAF domain-containing protein n=1 Tax=Salibacterium halotolerans TaxID=1884432 RepID=A0A1I5VKG0_9BACI|nr:GAF domain-containing protein [Salibacterium halotolerans]SFQ07466.1 GAF domain-containing protein [Salibacterium halotolerans]